MNDNLREKILNEAMGMTLPGLFSVFQYYIGNIHSNPSIKDMFLTFLTELMNKGILKLAHQDKFLEGSPEEQIELFRKLWPREYDENIPEKDIDYFWWWTVAPAGAVWIYPDGYEEWT